MLLNLYHIHYIRHTLDIHVQLLTQPFHDKRFHQVGLSREVLGLHEGWSPGNHVSQTF